MVEFDKGGRVARIAPGAHLDGRQVGILFAQLKGGERDAELLEWDQRKNPAMNARIEEALAKKGPKDKQTLLLLLSTDLLRRFRYEDKTQGIVADLRGERAKGYDVDRFEG